MADNIKDAEAKVNDSNMDEASASQSSGFKDHVLLTDCERENSAGNVNDGERPSDTDGKGNNLADAQEQLFEEKVAEIQDNCKHSIQESDDNSSIPNAENDEYNPIEARNDIGDASGDYFGYGSACPAREQPQHDNPGGPVRRRHSARQHRRQEAEHRIALPAVILAQWQRIGEEWGLHDNNEIAHFLMQRYEDSVAGRPLDPPPLRCAGCGRPLVPLPCDNCGPNQHSDRVASDHRRDRDRDMFCGRCRD